MAYTSSDSSCGRPSHETRHHLLSLRQESGGRILAWSTGVNEGGRIPILAWRENPVKWSFRVGESVVKSEVFWWKAGVLEMGLAVLSGYVIETRVFRGPLDLLLDLIEKEELDITQIALAQVTDQYLDYLSRLPRRDPAELSAFLWVAARLLWIKSRVLLPRPPLAVGEEGEEEGEDLVRRLQEYRSYRQAAGFLEERLKAGWRSWGRVSPPVLPPSRPAELEGVSLEALLAALQRRLAELAVEEGRPRPPSARVTLVEKARLIYERLRSHPEVSFQDLLAESSSREEVVVTFWAVLELFKRCWITLEQEELFGPIVIRRRSDTASAWEGHPEWWSELEDLA